MKDYLCEYKINLRDLFTLSKDKLPDWVNYEWCIYKITNLINGKCYIGQTKDFYNRFRVSNFSHLGGYIDQCINGGTKRLYNAFKKYGSRNFIVEIIDEPNEYDQSLLDDLEIYWIGQFDSINRSKGYNHQKGGRKTDYIPKNSIEMIRASQLRMRRFNEFSNINKVIDRIKKSGNKITPESYYLSYYNLHGIKDIDHHIEVITSELYSDPPIHSDKRWTPQIDLIFRYFDSKSFEELHCEFHIVAKSGGLCKLREYVISRLQQLESENNLNVDSYINSAGIDSFNRVKSYIDDPMVFTNDIRWKTSYTKLFK